MIFGRPVAAYLLSLLWFLTSSAYFVIALGYPAEARDLPVLVGGILVVFTALDLVAMTMTPAGAWLRSWLNPTAGPDPENPPDPIKKQVMALSCVAALVILLVLIGITAGIATYMVLSLRVLGKKPLLYCIMVSALTTGFCYLLFQIALGVDLYDGLLFSAPF